MLDGEPIFGIMQREKGTFFRMPPAQWQLAQLFDGEHTYEEIAEVFSEQTGSTVDPSDVRIFADHMDESDFWYKTPQEKNLALSAKLMAQRSRRVQQKAKVNLAHISFSAWDPDRYLGWLDRAAGRFIYSQWCILAVMLLFLFEVAVFVSQWSNHWTRYRALLQFLSQESSGPCAVLDAVPGSGFSPRDGTRPDLQALWRPSAQHGSDVSLSSAGVLRRCNRNLDIRHQAAATGHDHCRHLD